MTRLQTRLKISPSKLDDINGILLNPDMEVITDFLEVVAKYGTPEEINAKANQARKLDNLLDLVNKACPGLIEQKRLSGVIVIKSYLGELFLTPRKHIFAVFTNYLFYSW